MNVTEIRIKDAWLLRENASKHLHELWGENKHLAGDEDMQNIIKAYRREWSKFEDKILNGLWQILSVTYRKNIIDVYIAPWFYAFSDPLVIGVTLTPNEFVDVLTHELIHVLLTDNNKVSIDSLESPIGDSWSKLFGKMPFDQLVHIPVHAIHKKLYLEVLNDKSRLERDIEKVTKNKAVEYIEAWNYVNSHDYNEIIDSVKQAMDEV